MVRTKADAAVRVAAGGKAPKKSANYPSKHGHSSPTERGKDNLPVNRYFPRETPSWQKKITCFYDRHARNSEVIAESSVQPKDINIFKKNTKSLKRNSSDLDDENGVNSNKTIPLIKKIKTNNNMELEFQNINALTHSSEINTNESMDMDE